MGNENLRTPEQKTTVLREMPDKETLEQFLKQSQGGEVKVMFDIEKGIFHWITPRGEQRFQGQTWD